MIIYPETDKFTVASKQGQTPEQISYTPEIQNMNDKSSVITIKEIGSIEINVLENEFENVREIEDNLEEEQESLIVSSNNREDTFEKEVTTNDTFGEVINDPLSNNTENNTSRISSYDIDLKKIHSIDNDDNEKDFSDDDNDSEHDHKSEINNEDVESCSEEIHDDSKSYHKENTKNAMNSNKNSSSYNKHCVYTQIYGSSSSESDGNMSTVAISKNLEIVKNNDLQIISCSGNKNDFELRSCNHNKSKVNSYTDINESNNKVDSQEDTCNDDSESGTDAAIITYKNTIRHNIYLCSDDETCELEKVDEKFVEKFVKNNAPSDVDSIKSLKSDCDKFDGDRIYSSEEECSNNQHEIDMKKINIKPRMKNKSLYRRSTVSENIEKSNRCHIKKNKKSKKQKVNSIKPKKNHTNKMIQYYSDSDDDKYIDRMRRDNRTKKKKSNRIYNYSDSDDSYRIISNKKKKKYNKNSKEFQQFLKINKMFKKKKSMYSDSDDSSTERVYCIIKENKSSKKSRNKINSGNARCNKVYCMIKEKEINNVKCFYESEINDSSEERILRLKKKKKNKSRKPIIEFEDESENSFSSPERMIHSKKQNKKKTSMNDNNEKVNITSKKSKKYDEMVNKEKNRREAIEDISKKRKNESCSEISSIDSSQDISNKYIKNRNKNVSKKKQYINDMENSSVISRHYSSTKPIPKSQKVAFKKLKRNY